MSPAGAASGVATCANADVAQALAGLGWGLLQAAFAPGNDATAVGIFVSPLSVMLALALALNGAGPGSVTQQQLLTLLASAPATSATPAEDASLPEAQLNTQLSNLLDKLMSEANFTSNSAVAPPTLLIANGIFTKSGVNAEYTAAVASLYKATSQTVSGAQEVNDWVNANTKGEIPSLLDPSARFDTVLANALYFKGLWQKQFSKDATKARLFHAQGGDRHVLMMRGVFEKDNRVQVISAKSYQAVVLPYQGGQYSAMAVLPAPSVTLRDALEAIRIKSPQDRRAVQTPAITIVLLPKFRAEATLQLKDTLRVLGVQAAFEPSADFSRIASGLYISDVVHKTVVDVDEKGTVAAAATAVIMLRSAPMPEVPVELTFDRPFLFLIRHEPSDTIVFMGAVLNPAHAPGR